MNLLSNWATFLSQSIFNFYACNFNFNVGKMLSEIGVFVLVFAIAYFVHTYRRFRSFPPGPWGLPIIGYLPFMGSSPHTKYTELGKRYGKIFSVTFGNLPIVVLNDLDLIRKAFKQDVFQGRPKSVLAMSIANDGITFNEGKPWFEQRRFTLKVLRDLGFGKTSLESSLHEEVQSLIDYFRTQVNRPISLKHTFEIAVINTLWYIVCSKKYSLDDPEAIYMHKLCYEGFIEPEVAGPVWFMPWLAKLAPNWTGLNALIRATDETLALFRKMVNERRKTWNPTQLNDFVDAYLLEMENTKDPNSSFYKEEGMKNLVCVLSDLFTAGSDTTSSTLSWAFLYMLHYPEVLAKVREEIDTVVGRKELPSTEHRINLPYTEATIHEIFRMSSIVCGALLHSTMENTRFEGYNLPKGTIVMSNLYHVHHDPLYWGDPENFRPERFLDSEGRFRKDEALVPFCVGKRICPAENLATTNVYLFFTGMVQNFDFTAEFPLPSLDAKPGLVLATQNYKLILHDRN